MLRVSSGGLSVQTALHVYAHLINPHACALLLSNERYLLFSTFRHLRPPLQDTAPSQLGVPYFVHSVFTGEILPYATQGYTPLGMNSVVMSSNTRGAHTTKMAAWARPRRDISIDRGIGRCVHSPYRRQNQAETSSDGVFRLARCQYTYR